MLFLLIRDYKAFKSFLLVYWIFVFSTITDDLSFQDYVAVMIKCLSKEENTDNKIRMNTTSHDGVAFVKERQIPCKFAIESFKTLILFF